MILIGKRIQKQHIPFNQRVTVLINLRGLRWKLARREKILKTSSFCSLGLSLQLCKRRALQYVLLEEKLCLDLHRPVIIISLCLKISVCVRVCLCVCTRLKLSLWSVNPFKRGARWAILFEMLSIGANTIDCN